MIGTSHSYKTIDTIPNRGKCATKQHYRCALVTCSILFHVTIVIDQENIDRKESLRYRAHQDRQGKYSGLHIICEVDSDESEEDKSETKDDAPKASMVLSQKNECKCLSCGKTLRKSKYKLERERELRVFIAMIKEKPMLLEEWSDDLWISLIESGTVHRDGSITFLFKNGASIHVTQ